MITHELLRRPLTTKEGIDLAEYLTAKVKTAFVTKPGYFYLDQDDTVYLGVDGRYGPTTLWRVQDQATYGDQHYWEKDEGREFRPLWFGLAEHFHIEATDED